MQARLTKVYRFLQGGNCITFCLLNVWKGHLKSCCIHNNDVNAYTLQKKKERKKKKKVYYKSSGLAQLLLNTLNMEKLFNNSSLHS